MTKTVPTRYLSPGPRTRAARASLGACALVIALGAGGLPPRDGAHADSSGTPPQSMGTVTMTNQTPAIVLNGQATLLGAHDPAAPLTINMIMPLRNQPGLDAFIKNFADNGIYLTQQQFDADYGVPAVQVQAVRQWGQANNLQPTFTAADGTIVTLRGTTAAVASALHIAINNYRSPKGFTFYSNDRDATVPAALGVVAVDGLNDIPRFHTDSIAASKALFHAALATAHGGTRAHGTTIRPYGDAAGFFPADFRAAYDVAGHGIDGTGQVIGFTLWGAPVPNSDFTGFHNLTGEPTIVGGTAQNGGTATSTTADAIDWIYTNGVDTTTDAQGETAMDTEEAHGMAPHSHLRYWLGNQVGTCPSCGGSNVGLENAISMATADPQVHVVSNSWGGGEAPSVSDPFFTATNQQFLKAISVGTTFYFSSGDNGTDSGGTGLPSYPADSANVVAVGGTSLFVNSNGSYSSESVWADLFDSGGEGAGCSSIIAEPSFQNIAAVNNVATCHLTANSATRGRAEPDVVADADPATGAAVFTGGSEQGIGGTSLAAPLWAGMAALADRFASVNSRTRIGWAAPKIYTLANNPTKYATDFHDVNDGSTTNGSLSFSAGTGWDQATGWGSIDWFKWVQDMVPASTGAATTTTVSTSLTPSKFGQSVTFTAHVTSTSGTPAGTVTFKDGTTTLGTGTLSGGAATFATSALAAGTHSITAAYGGATGFAASTSTAISQVVNAASTTTTVTSSLNPSTVGQSVTFTAHVAAVAPGSGTPAGTVTFKDGTTTLGTGTLSGGAATFATSALAAGTHSITAAYGGAASFVASTSTALSQVVNSAGTASTTTTLSALPTSAAVAQAVTLVAHVTSTAGTPTGTVTFKDGATALGTITLSSGAASLSTSFTALGTHALTAVYNPTGAFLTSTSSAVAFVVYGPIVVHGKRIAPVRGTAFSLLIGSFTDARPGLAAANYRATIDWGDGTAVTAGVVAGSGGTYTITGSHTYATTLAAGTYPIDVTIGVTDGRSAYLASIAQAS